MDLPWGKASAPAPVSVQVIATTTKGGGTTQGVHSGQTVASTDTPATAIAAVAAASALTPAAASAAAPVVNTNRAGEEQRRMAMAEEKRAPRDLFAALRAHFSGGASRLKDTFNELDKDKARPSLFTTCPSVIVHRQ